MRRRKMLLATGGLLASATAGCLGTGPGSETTPQPTVNVEVEFTVEDGDLVASHLSGDVLQSGQTVYVTIEGDQVAEKTLSSDVHTGGEIIRVNDVKFTEEKRVGLYLQRDDQSEELAATTVGNDGLNQPAPSTQVAFDYDATVGEVVIVHDGGATLNPENTGELTVTGGSITDADVTWNAPVTGSGTSATLDGTVSAGDQIATISNVTNSGESVNLVWNSVGGSNSQEIGTWEAP